MKKLELVVLMILVLMSSCIKDELPVPAVHPGDAVAGEVCISPTYQDQVYYNIASNSIVASNHLMDWDIAIRSDISNAFVWMNTARLMRAALSTATDITAITDTIPVSGQFMLDVSSGHVDSLAINLAEVLNQVLILDMGYNHIGQHQGFKKLKVESFSANSIDVRYADLYVSDFNDTELITIAPDLSSYMTYVSLIGNQLVSLEPPSGSYDLLFTRFTSFVVSDTVSLDYLVTGALIEPEQVRVAEFENADFHSVQLLDTLTNPFVKDRDVIGFDWKHFDFDFQVFVTDPTRVYIIQDASGSFHKLRFTDFYNDLGQKGCPQFEVISY